MRTKIRDLRRRELVEAMRDVIAENGFENATIADIAKKAGFSMGYLHHHFRNKDELLLENKRVLYGDMRRFLAQKLTGSSDPLERLHIVIEAYLRPEQFSRESAYGWLSFIARAPFNKDYRRFQNIIDRRLYSNLMASLKLLMPRDKAELAINELTTLLDGYWVRLGTKPDSITSEDAIKGLRSALDRLLES